MGLANCVECDCLAAAALLHDPLPSGAQKMKNIEEPVPTFMVEMDSASKVLATFKTPSIAEPDPTQRMDPLLIEKTKVPAIAVLPLSLIHI